VVGALSLAAIVVRDKREGCAAAEGTAEDGGGGV
jgi:hypothetical protein